MSMIQTYRKNQFLFSEALLLNTVGILLGRAHSLLNKKKISKMVSEGSSNAILLDFQRRPAGQVNCRSWQLTGRFSNGVWQALAWQEASGLQKRDRESPK